MSDNQCHACGQWSGKGHRCPTPATTSAPALRVPVGLPADSAVLKEDVSQRVARADAVIAAALRTAELEAEHWMYEDPDERLWSPVPFESVCGSCTDLDYCCMACAEAHVDKEVEYWSTRDAIESRGHWTHADSINANQVPDQYKDTEAYIHDLPPTVGASPDQPCWAVLSHHEDGWGVSIHQFGETEQSSDGTPAKPYVTQIGWAHNVFSTPQDAQAWAEGYRYVSA